MKLIYQSWNSNINFKEICYIYERHNSITNVFRMVSQKGVFWFLPLYRMSKKECLSFIY